MLQNNKSHALKIKTGRASFQIAQIIFYVTILGYDVARVTKYTYMMIINIKF